VFIYPSLYEGFGIPPLEAMAAGTPVVAMHASSVPEVCGPAAAYARPDDPASLQQALESVALSPATAAALVAAGHERLKLFSWERSAATAAAAYRALL
jgi:glycosyltransferase involved in cell wall biosynthesis